MSVGGSVGVAALGSLYLTLARTETPAAPGAATAAHAFAVASAALAGLGVLAALAAYRAALSAAPQTAERTQAQAPARLAAEALVASRATQPIRWRSIAASAAAASNFGRTTRCSTITGEAADPGRATRVLKAILQPR